jgi:hypothetical protein
MELSIQKYCTITPLEVGVNGQKLIDIEASDSPDQSLVQTYRNLGIDYLKFFKMDNLSKLSILATDCLLKDTELYTITDNNNVAVVLSNASSSLVTDERYQQSINDAKSYFPSPSLFVYTLPNIAIGEICIKYKIYGENIFLISQFFNAQTLHLHVNELFAKTNTRFCITGWVECTKTSYEAFIMLVVKGKNDNQFDIKTLKKLYKNKKR